MKATLKRTIAMFLALSVMLSLCVFGKAPKAAAAQPQTANVALGKTVTFGYGSEVTAGDANYGVSAVQAGLSVLTDGVSHSTNWWVNNGNPYVALKSSVITGPYSFTVDLGKDHVTEQISIYSYSRPDWSIYPVESVSYSGSVNGSSWTELGSVTLEQAQVKTVDDPRYEGTTVDIYEFTLSVETTARYVRVSFSTNASGLVGIGEMEVYGITAPEMITKGAAITYFGHGTEVGSDGNWGDAAVRAGLSVLTDGVGNSPNWWVNNGNPNIGLKAGVLPGPYVFNLDIGTASTLSRISSYFYSRTDWGVDAPDGVTYSVSTDGIIWKELGSVSKNQAAQTVLVDDRNPDAQRPTIYTFTLLFDRVDARYVKISFNSNTVGLIGFQELQAHGTKKVITNLALGKMASANNYTYQVTGGGTGYESTGTTKPDGSRYTVTEVENASASRLTDGVIVNASKVTYPSNWASQAWNSSGTIMSKYLQIYRNDSRIITLDLGAVRNVTGIRMHFGAQESMGFYLPTNVTYYLSQNGEDYYQAADVWNYQTTADDNDANISGTAFRHEWYSASGINYNARYVKLIFPVNVYILTDELQVYGSEILSSGATELTSMPKYDPLEKFVGHFADGIQSGGVRNEFMAYSGWYVNSDGGEVYNTYKTVKEYMTSIAYIDANGVPQDWLFDDVTVMGHYYTAKGTFNSYKAGYTQGKYYANQSDWYQWLCYAFGKDTSGNNLSYSGNDVINLEALEEAARIAKETLNDPGYKVGVKLVLYPAVEYQENWGTIDGETIDFTVSGCGSQEKALANRAKAYQWYIDQAVAMWENADFQHLELTGFYYYEETIHESTDRIAKAATQALTDIVHTHATPITNTKPAFDSRVGGRLYIYQLPFYQSEGYWNWAEYGFDYALMQPNYSFYDMYTLTQLKECADLCTYYGLGMQMEFGGTASTAYHKKFEDYLNYGKEYGYQSAVVSWYMSTWGCYSMAYNNNGTRYLYDMVYDFVKGQTIPVCQHPTHRQNGRCEICAEYVGHTVVDGACSGCGLSCVHSYEETVTAPTCETQGFTTFTCTLCGTSFKDLFTDPTGHQYKATVIAPTCITGGYTSYVCSCGDRYADEETDPTGHRYETVTVNATCTVDGSVTDTCADCGDTKVQILPATGHSHRATVIDPTCTTGGYTTYTCFCGDTYRADEVSALGHSYENGICGNCGAADPDYVEPVVTPTLTLKSPTLEFKDMITVNAFFTAENIEDVVEMGMITYKAQVDEWNVDTADFVIPGTSYDATTGRYIAHSQGINAKYLGDTVYLACYAKLTDGRYVYTKLAPYSPVQYATNQLKNSTDTKLKQLVAAMLNYGAEAQKFFGHNTGSLANATLTDEQKLLPEAYRADMVASVPAVDAAKQGIFANNKGFAKRYPAISFEGAFCINYFFKPNYTPVGDITLYYWNEADFETASVLTKENASGTLTLALEDSGEYRADIEGIAAKNLSEAVYVAAVYSDGTTQWSSGVLGYSIGAYCASQISKAADVAALAEATAVYGYHAKQYFNPSVENDSSMDSDELPPLVIG